MSDQTITKITKEVPHDKETCIRESKWYLIKLLDEKDELRKTFMVKFTLEHLNHLK